MWKTWIWILQRRKAVQRQTNAWKCFCPCRDAAGQVFICDGWARQPGPEQPGGGPASVPVAAPHVPGSHSPQLQRPWSGTCERCWQLLQENRGLLLYRHHRCFITNRFNFMHVCHFCLSGTGMLYTSFLLIAHKFLHLWKAYTVMFSAVLACKSVAAVIFCYLAEHWEHESCPPWAGAVEALPWGWHGDDHNQGRKVSNAVSVAKN